MNGMVRIAGIALALLLGACATAPERSQATVPANLFDDSAFDAPTESIDPAQALALSPPMQRYLEVEIAPQIRRMGRQEGLVDALYNRAQLRLEYDSETTRTAAQAFDARAGNCLSLVLMTAAMAKHLQLPVSYQAVVGEEVWSRDGDLSLAIGHVNITVAKRLVDRVQGLDSQALLQLNFGAPWLGRGSMLRPVNEHTIVAMFMNNRAAERLTRGHQADAYAYARAAILQAPGFASAYNTLGVIYQRRGLAARAEQAYRVALEIDAASRPALANLARLLEPQGRDAEAAALRARLAKLESEAPFLHFDLGRAAVMAGDFQSGRQHLLRELKRDPDYHEFHFWLAMALAGMGDLAGAQEHLVLARNNSTTRRDHALYAGKLERLLSVQRSN
jgi:tetratricopeptide (TPR) repeat protein